MTCMSDVNVNNRINFKSTIRLVKPNTFIKTINRIYDNEVIYPWTIKESLILKDVYTRGVFDCGVVGVTNGKEALLMHICPTKAENAEFVKIREYLLKKIDFLRNEYLQGFVLGGKSNSNVKSPKSMEYVNNYCDIFQKEGIPFSKFTGGIHWNDVAYFTEKDTWLIGNEKVEYLQRSYTQDPLTAANLIFDDVKVCHLDELNW